MPQVIRELLQAGAVDAGGNGSSKFQMEATLEDHPGEDAGGRNPVFCRLVGEYLHRRGIDQLLDHALRWNQRCKPPKPDEKIVRDLFGLLKRHFQREEPRATAAAESPPPTIVMVPASEARANAWAIATVPASKGGDSNTPIGPFQTTVFAFPIHSAYRLRVSCPISYMLHPLGTASRATVQASDGSYRSCAITTSVGSTTRSPPLSMIR